MDLTGSKVGRARPQTSAAGRDEGTAESGFTLVEVVCCLAIIALIAAFALPSIPRSTSRATLEAYAIKAATLLKADRDAAIRGRNEIATMVNGETRSLRSGATGKEVRIPPDVHFEALLAARCNGRMAGRTITFFASGMSCGGMITLTRPVGGFQIRVNWLTGGVEIVPLKAA
jgi:general secretion pathway protein H